MAANAQLQLPKTRRSAPPRPSLPQISPTAKQTRRSGGAPAARGPWVPPPLPRCASELPAHYSKGRTEALKLRRTLVEETFERLDFHGFGGDVDGLRALLAHKYGGSAQGWRKAIAPDKVGLGRVTFQDFCMGMRRIGYSGHAMSLWKALSGDNKKVALWDFEPDLASQLDECAQGIADCFKRGGTFEAWKLLRRRHAGRATFEEFQNFMLDTEEREILQEDNEVDLRRVFEALDMSGRGSISREDFHFFDHWAHKRLGLRLHDDPAQEPEEEQHWEPPPKPPPLEPGLLEFQAFCEVHFGSPGRAWRVALDMKGCGSLTLGELGQGCRGMGWRHSHRLIYEQLCREGHGLATLRALDPKSAQAVDDFGRAIVAKYDGDMYEFWTTHLDPGDSGTVKKSAFIATCMRELDMEAELAKLLFILLDPARTGWIAVTELDFINSFECALITETVGAEDPSGSPASEEGGSLVASYSAPALYPDRYGGSGADSSDDTTSVSSWDSIRDGLWSPAKSTRAMQHRCLAQSMLLKKRWLKGAALDYCLAAEEKKRELQQGMSEREREKSELCRPNHRDIFRTSHGFYLEGVKRIKALAERDPDLVATLRP